MPETAEVSGGALRKGLGDAGVRSRFPRMCYGGNRVSEKGSSRILGEYTTPGACLSEEVQAGVCSKRLTTALGVGARFTHLPDTVGLTSPNLLR